jgi:ribonuclease HI
MQPPKTTKEVQRLTGRVAALNWFMSRSTDKCLPFFKTLKKAFEWTDECQQAFEELKKYLTEPPLLSPSKQGEELYLYLAVSPTAVSSALIREEERRQLPVYYTSRALRGAEERYPPMEKLAFALVTAARKLRPYFQAHTIVLLTNHPLRKAMNKPDAAGRLIQWSIELSEFDIDYRPRTAIKAQALADFIAEFTSKDDEPTKDVEQTSKWTMNIDGSSTKDSGGIGVVLKSPEGDTIKQAVRLQYPTTNNEAEYEALLTGLEMAKVLGATELDVLSDSQLVVGEVNGDYEAKEGRMQRYLHQARHRISQFREVRLSRIPREQNTEADQLVKSASSSTADDKIKIVQQSSLQTTEMNPVHTETSWMTPIISYLQRGTLPDNRHEARRLKVRASRFLMLQGTLYKRSFSLPYLRCLAPDEASYVMREIHEGICGDHSGARALQRKIVRAGYYWPSMKADAFQFVQHCDKCQRFANLLHSPPAVLVPMVAPWPFAQWGLDIMGPFPIGRRQLKFLVVAIDYFTKWVEAEPLATITERNIQNFVWKAVICRFGIPRVLVSDNGKQFDNPRFRQFSQELGIHNHYSSPGHPQANGQVEVTNRSLLKLIKTRLEGAKGLWPEELPSILWAYRTTVRIPTGETPFRMTFGSEAVVPVEIGLTTLRTSTYDEQQNEEQLRLNLDLIDEVRETAEARMKRYQEKMARHYNSKVKPRQLSVGDLVLRKVTLATKNPSEGKLGPNWEGPYKVIEVRRPGTYHLEDMNGRRLSRPWNAEHLRKYYP